MFLLKTLNGAEMAPVRIFHKVLQRETCIHPCFKSHIAEFNVMRFCLSVRLLLKALQFVTCGRWLSLTLFCLSQMPAVGELISQASRMPVQVGTVVWGEEEALAFASALFY